MLPVGLALVGGVAVKGRLLVGIQFAPKLLQLVQPVDVLFGLAARGVVAEAEALVGVEWLVYFVKLYLSLGAVGLLHHAFAHEYGVVLGGVLERHLAVLHIAHILCLVPVQRIGVGVRHPWAQHLEVAVGYALQQGKDACAVLLIGGGGAALYVGLVHGAVQLVIHAKQGGQFEHGLIGAVYAFLLHADVERALGVAFLAKVGHLPHTLAALCVAQVEAGRGRLVLGAHPELVFGAHHLAGLRVVVQYDIEPLVGGAIQVFNSYHRGLELEKSS